MFKGIFSHRLKQEEENPRKFLQGISHIPSLRGKSSKDVGIGAEVRENPGFCSCRKNSCCFGRQELWEENIEGNPGKFGNSVFCPIPNPAFFPSQIHPCPIPNPSLSHPRSRPILSQIHPCPIPNPEFLKNSNSPHRKSWEKQQGLGHFGMAPARNSLPKSLMG